MLERVKSESQNLLMRTQMVWAYASIKRLPGARYRAEGFTNRSHLILKTTL